MMASLEISGFALISHLEMDFTRGLNIITGETGSGKSTILDAISFVLGAKGHQKNIHPEYDDLKVTIVFEFEPPYTQNNHYLHEYLDKDNRLILTRSLSRNNKSRARINGHTTNITEVQKLRHVLFEFNCQHQSLELLSPSNHTHILDNFLHPKDELSNLKKAYKTWDEINQSLKKLIQEGISKEQYQWYLHQIDDLQSVPDDLDISVLMKNYKKQASSESILETAATIESLFSNPNNQGLYDTLREIYKHLSPLMTIEPNFEIVQKILEQSQTLLSEAQSKIEDIMRDNQYDEYQHQQLEKEITLYNDLARKYRVHIEELVELKQNVILKIQQYENHEQTLEKLNIDLTVSFEYYIEKAKKLSQARLAAFMRLEGDLVPLLKKLGFKYVNFAIAHTISDNIPSTNGIDSIKFLFSSNRGHEAKPLGEIASGGELSRLTLALSVLAGNIGTKAIFIYDEVDVGVSGPTADTIGTLIRKLSRRCQILCITHLPQVAAYADSHHKIEKNIDETSTHVLCKNLNHIEKVQEMARLLSGGEILPEALEHAKRLRDLAQSENLELA